VWVVEGDDITTLVGRFYDRLWNAWDEASVGETLATGFTFRGSLGQSSTGRDGWRRYRDIVRRGSSDFHNDVIELVAAGDRAGGRRRLADQPTRRSVLWSVWAKGAGNSFIRSIVVSS
jgi:hypothetical protein